MRHLQFRHIAAAGAIAVMATVPLAACGDPSVSPRPPQAADNATSAAPGRVPSATPSAPARAQNPEPAAARQPAAPGPVRTKTVKPTSTKPTSTKPTGTCYGAVRHDLDLRNTVLDLVKSMCFHTGGVLRLQGIGPGLVTATPGSLVSQNYAGGVVDLRFVRPGTVTVTIPQDERTYTITVVVVR
ncbi:hypothetical protein QLQ12_36630 [Actinoplanes sp. NEAU-A12]|uniref:Uncharacterized protein n=1 Tax=Actinoplanes sandaracinus TaxID=3045177 RepID=A0ABT6WWK7_9ACTN|nr:hypothetical protein [Actinoplanes sandaracinus]MDI6104133.1 hypothetical protein [Actinoplanes sandaracinus]